MPEQSCGNCMRTEPTQRQGRYRGMLVIVLALLSLLGNAPSLFAYTLTPETWNVIGLDSNDVTVGPNRFPVGAKVCGGTSGATVNVYFSWLTSNSYIDLRPGSKGAGGTPLPITFGADGCADAFFEAEVVRDANAYSTGRQYKIYIGSDSTPTPRELYVERLISQARNAITDVKVDGVSIPAGGSMNLTVGNTYTIQLIGGTATQGYNQFSSFFSLSNTIFQVISVSSSYSANTSPYVPNPVYGTGLYADACKWDSDPGSPTYRSCIGGDYKAGGSNVVTTYLIKIIGGGGTSVSLSSMLFDFSGASYHYNGDYATSTRIAGITDPASLGITKNFSPNPTNAGGVSTLSFVISNPNMGAVSGVAFTDLFPVSPGAMTLSDTITTNTCGGILTNGSGGALTTGATGIRLTGGTVAGNGNCVVQVNITPAVSGSYTNTSGNLFVNSVDTGKYATATLTVNSTPPLPAPPSTCASPVEMARWTMDQSPAPTAPPGYFSKAANVSTATASFTTASGVQSVAGPVGTGNATNSWSATAPTGSGGWAENPVSPNYTMNNYFQVVLDTSNYGGVKVTFDAGLYPNSDWANPLSTIFVTSSTNGSAFTLNSSTPQASKGSWVTGIAASAATTGTSQTTFRFGTNGSGANKPGATLYLDNIVFSGCPRPVPPTITKSFATNPVAVGGTSVLTFTITNPNSCCILNGLSFTDTLPQVNLQGSLAVTNGVPNVTGTGTAFKTQLTSGSVLFISGVSYTVASIVSDTQMTLSAIYTGATASGLTATSGLTLVSAVTTPQCGGTVTGTAGGTSIALSGGTLAAGAGSTCTITATVKDSIAGTINNVSGPVSSTDSGQNSTSTGIAKASLSAVLPPSISKRFAPNPILSGGTSTLTFLISNPNQNNSLGGVSFTDTFPATMTVALPASPSTSGCGTPVFAPAAGAASISFSAVTTPQCGGTVTGTAGGTSIALSGGTLAAGAGSTCTITATVKDSIAGTINNVSGPVSSTDSGQNSTSTGIAKASLSAVLPPSISKRFAPNPILSGGTSTLTFLISNPNQNNSLGGVSFTDTFPATMTVALPASPSTSGCGTPVFAPAAGAASISFSGGTIAAGGTCTVTVQITATAGGINTSGFVSATTAGNGNTASDTLAVTTPHPAISMFKEIAASDTAATVWSYYLALPVGGNVYYQFQVQNDGDVDLTNVQVTDDRVAMAGCNWKDGDGLGLTPPFTLKVANASNNKDFATCTLGPIPVSSAGAVTNTATGEGYYSGTRYVDTDYAIYATTSLNLVKSVTETMFKSGDTLHYSYQVTNNGYATLNGPVTVTDDKTTVTCPALNTIGNLNNYLEQGETVTCTATYAVTAADVTAGIVTNTASAATPAGGSLAGAVSPTVSKSLTTQIPLQVTKSQSTSSAAPGTVVTYEIVYVNPNPTAMFKNITITDQIPAYTSYQASSCGALPPGITSCTPVYSSPPAGVGNGQVVWTLDGTLNGGATGTLQLIVTIH